jgi:hypothetical protein
MTNGEPSRNAKPIKDSRSRKVPLDSRLIAAGDSLRAWRANPLAVAGGYHASPVDSDQFTTSDKSKCPTFSLSALKMLLSFARVRDDVLILGQLERGTMMPEDTLIVLCPCGKKLKAPATAAGKKARCPACGNTLVLSAGAAKRTTTAATIAKPPVTPPKAPIPPDDDDGLGALYDLVEQGNAAPAAEMAVATRCPQCKSEMEDDAVLCTNCGYDIRTGKAVATATVAAAVAKPATLSYRSAPVAGRGGKKPVDLMAPQGSFLAGLALSAAFALAGSVLWIVIAWTTGYVIGYIAIAIGAAAGIGMRIGQKGFSTAGGAAAAGLTVCAILFAKLAVVEILLNSLGLHISIFDLNGSRLGHYLFSPMSLVFMVIGVGAAFRTANGSVSG